MTEMIANFTVNIASKINELNVNVSKLQTSIEELNKYSNNIHEEIKKLQTKQIDGEDIEQQLEQLKKLI